MKNRFLSIDSLRGFAMVLVILQHSYLSTNMTSIPKFIDMLVWSITALAAVAFVSISGAMYSYFLYIQPDWRLAYRRYAGRALFLLLAVHPMINLTSCCFRLSGTGTASGFRQVMADLFLDFPITDTIGLCMLLTPLIILSFNTLQRFMIIVGMLLITVLIRALVIPADPHVQILKEALFGGLSLPKVFWFPLIPWIAIFLTGSFVGQGMMRLRQGSLKVQHLIQALNTGGCALAVSYVVLMIGYKFIKMYWGVHWNQDIMLAISPSQTTTMLPGYLAVLSWLLAALIHRIDVSGHYDRLAWFLSISGRTSLFTYVVQFIIVESVPALLGYKGALGLTGFILLFFIGLFIMTLLSYIYGRMRGWIMQNDYINTVHIMKKPG
jgi:uncharacterized membrane protein